MQGLEEEEEEEELLSHVPMQHTTWVSRLGESI
jgi:hypothetical protein